MDGEEAIGQIRDEKRAAEARGCSETSFTNVEN
jgi:hypothetical protein